MIKLENILRESVFDTYTKQIARDIINAFKDKRDFEEFYVLERGGEEAEFDLIVKFHERPNQDYSHSITGGGSADELSIDVEYNPKDFPQAMNDFNAEVFESVRHELEHVGQQNFDDMFMVGRRDYDSYQGYLTSQEEVPAYVQGFITRARKKKQTLDQVMEDWHRENALNFKKHTDANWSEIKQTWMNWAKANKDRLRKIKA